MFGCGGFADSSPFMHHLLHSFTYLHFPVSYISLLPPLALVFTSRISVLPLPSCQIEALKTDTSVRLGGRRLGGGVKEEIEGRGCIRGLKLNEAVCSLGNSPLQVPNKTPHPPLLLSKNIHNPLKQRGKKRRNIKSSYKYCKVPFNPPHPVQSHLFSHFVLQ